jgi:hypothetical protein
MHCQDAYFQIQLESLTSEKRFPVVLSKKIKLIVSLSNIEILFKKAPDGDMNNRARVQRDDDTFAFCNPICFCLHP